MSTITDPSTIKKPNSFICRSSKVLGNIILSKMYEQETSFSEAKLLLCESLKKQKKDAEAITSSGHPRNVAQLQIEILNKYIPKLQKVTPDNLNNLRLEVSTDIDLSYREGSSSRHEVKMPLYLTVLNFLDDLTMFGA